MLAARHDGFIEGSRFRGLPSAGSSRLKCETGIGESSMRAGAVHSKEEGAAKVKGVLGEGSRERKGIDGEVFRVHRVEAFRSGFPSGTTCALDSIQLVGSTERGRGTVIPRTGEGVVARQRSRATISVQRLGIT